jgi:hypothetical protein
MMYAIVPETHHMELTNEKSSVIIAQVFYETVNENEAESK